jgi:hypothetical protein
MFEQEHEKKKTYNFFSYSQTEQNIEITKEKSPDFTVSPATIIHYKKLTKTNNEGRRDDNFESAK